MATWAYLYLHDDTNPDADRVVIEAAGVTTMLIPVPAVEDAPAVAAAAVADGAELLELCGGFTTEWAAKVREAVEVPVGHVMFAMDSVIGAGRYAEQFSH